MSVSSERLDAIYGVESDDCPLHRGFGVEPVFRACLK